MYIYSNLVLFSMDTHTSPSVSRKQYAIKLLCVKQIFSIRTNVSFLTLSDIALLSKNTWYAVDYEKKWAKKRILEDGMIFFDHT